MDNKNAEDNCCYSFESGNGGDKKAVPFASQSQSSIFQLDIDCFHEIFDWLSLEGLNAVGQTCKRLQRIAGSYVNVAYAAKIVRGENDGIYISSIKSNIFAEYIQKISISGDRLGAYRFVAANCSTRLKCLRVYGSLPEGGFEYIKDILRGVEALEMNECLFSGDFYEKYLRYCPHLKSLSVSQSSRIHDKSIIIGDGNEWLLREYPSLQHLELIDFFGLKNDELKVFFDRNPTVRTFSTDSKGLWENRYSILNSTLKLDTLAIDIYQSMIYDCDNRPVSMIDAGYELLVELHNRGFYRRLNLYMVFIDRQNINKLLSLRGIEMINGDIVRVERHLAELKAFAVWCGDEILDIETLPMNMPNIERAYFARVTSNRIIPFICNSPKLRQIRIRKLIDLSQFMRLDLRVLNEERGKLLGACRVIIYLKEDVYLTAKWTMDCIQFEFIELKRCGLKEWEELYSRAKYLKSF